MTQTELQATNKAEVAPQKGEFTREGVYFSPAVDIYATEKELVLVADMPGVGPDGVDIELRDNVLSIIGKVEESPSKLDTLLAEYRFGSYFRTFQISEIVDQSKITASIADGVLKLVLPKVAKAVPRKIPIAGA
jgi:HSP20 family protein